MNAEHLIREIKQINLIQQKLIQSIETKNAQKKPTISEAISDLESVDSLTKTITDKLEANSVISKELGTQIAHDLRTPLTPILTYTEMLLKNHFGDMTKEQKEKIQIINTNIKQLVSTINAIQESKVKDTTNTFEQKKEPSRHDQDAKNLDHKRREFEQEKFLLGKIVKAVEEKNRHLSKKNMITIAASIAIIGVVITAYSLFVVSLVGEQYRVSNIGTAKTSYVIQNLRGDTIDTWLSWRLVDSTTMHVNVPDGAKYPEKLSLIKQVIGSEESIEIDDSLLHKGPQGSTSVYYVGWTGALKSISKQTQYFIPNEFQVIESATGEGEITILLTEQQHGDGYAGYTKSIADESQNQILKSEITVFEINKLTDEQFRTVLRHEFGHALGLAHSTAPEDLMAPIITTEFPYISDCDIDAIVKLYDGGKSSQVVCEK